MTFISLYVLLFNGTASILPQTNFTYISKEHKKQALYTYVILRSDCHQLFFHAVTDVQTFDKLVNSLFSHLLVCASQRFQSLVRMRISLAPKNGLNSLGNYCPGIFEVGFKLFFVQDELAKTLQCALNSDAVCSRATSEPRTAEWHWQYRGFPHCSRNQ